MIKRLARPIVHKITGTRKFYYRRLEEISATTKGKKILEIGSGKQVKGEEAYSAIHIFDNAKEFRQTDVNPEFGHEILDITDMDIKNEYDVILCLNVLEHVYDHDAAVKNMHAALRKGGRLIIAVPFAFPLHDEPHDYWRYTRFALEKLLSDFKKVDVEVKGSEKFPYGHFVVATKK